MNGRELASKLGPLVKTAGRQRLGPLAMGKCVDVHLRYEEVRDWDALGNLLMERSDVLQLYDGMEWFAIEIWPLNERVTNGG